MEYKTSPTSIQSIEDNVVTGVCAVTGNVDLGNDRLHRGAFTKSIQERKSRIPHLWSHQADQPPIATIVDLQEIGRNDLPQEVKSEYPESTGGLLVKRRYLDTPRSQEVLTGIKENAISGMSFGYEPIKGKVDYETLDGKRVRNLREVKLYETSDTPFPMNEATRAQKGLINEIMWGLGTGQDLTHILRAGASLTPMELDQIVAAIERLMQLCNEACELDQDETKPMYYMSANVAERLQKTLQSAHWIGIKGALPYKATPKAPEDETWNGPAEVAKADVAALKAMCAWVDSENAEDKTAYKLPHHKAEGNHAVVWNGVKAAMGALLGARGGIKDVSDADRKAIYSHLSKHYKQFGQTPPDMKSVEFAWGVQDARILLASGVDFKEGRMISAANQAKIKDVIDAIEAQLETLEDLLGTAESPAEEAEGKSLTDPTYLLALLDLNLADLDL